MVKYKASLSNPSKQRFCPGVGGPTLADRRGCSAEVRKMDPTWDSKFAKKVTLNGTEIPKFSQIFYFFPKFSKNRHPTRD